ncbi:MAG: tetratricopeptide repeat protein, partial [Hyphomicrobiales bacterium]|nr:tetratricopeptide repeat protein [Hyphomicrobiales bacterium]
VEDLRMMFRIGINVGDVMVEGDNLFGDGVNVAARLEGVAEAGGICISGSAFDQVKNKLSIGFEDIGPQDVKNIPEPVPAFAVVLAAGGVAWRRPFAPDLKPASTDKMALKLPDRPSIAVLPFTNMSADPEQEYFSDGITEDIITDLSKVSGLIVIARNSSFKYKGKFVDVRDVARDLGVGHVLEGSVRRSGEQLRITAQLTDGKTGKHLWAEHYDRKLKDVFAVQNDVTRSVVSELAVTLKASEQERLFRRHTDNLEAYETFLRARRLMELRDDPERRIKRKKLLERVIELDPTFAGGYAGLSFAYSRDLRYQRGASQKEDIERALELAKQATSLDDTLAYSYVALGNARLMNHDHDLALAAMRQAVEVQPGYADAHMFLGFIFHWMGQGNDAITALKTALELDPKSWGTVSHIGMAHFTAGRYEDAVRTLEPDYAERARRGANSLCFLAAAYAATGRDKKAHAAMKAFLDKHPERTLSNYQHPHLYKRKEDQDRYLSLLRKAGMPE